MANNDFQWEGNFTDEGLVIDLTSTLADDALSPIADSTEFDNAAAGHLRMWGWLQLETSSGNVFSTTPSAGNIRIYRHIALDGTNYEDAPDATDINEQSDKHIGSFIIPSHNFLRLASRPFLLMPGKQKFQIYNEAAASITANGRCRLFTAVEEVE